MAKPTTFQREIAKKLGISLRGATSLVAAARIRDAVALAIAPDVSPRAPTEAQVTFARDLGVFRKGDSFEVCRAKIQEELTRRNALALMRLKLQPGDVVEYTRRHFYGEPSAEIRSEHVVSSIGKDLRVYFRNPQQSSGGWPSQLKILRRAT